MDSRSEPIPAPNIPTNALLSLNRLNATNSATIPAAMPNMFAVPTLQPSSVINLTNSSDVVIGPMTQYQGPVTIYQYMDATVEARASHSNTGIRQNNTTQKQTLLQNFNKNSKIAILLIIVLIVGIGVAIYFILNQKTPEKSKGEILFGNDYDSGTFPNLGNGHLVIDRQQWGAAEKSSLTIPLEHPIPYILITHVGVQASPCMNVYRCSIKMRTYQDSSVAERNLPDISANFYVGNDGNVYVGRGWDFANTYTNQTLAICFLGDFMRYEPDPKQLEAVQYLLSYGITKKYIAIDYKLVAQNQTRNTRSPGTNVYKEIIKWPHWYPCGINDNPQCGKEIGLPKVWDANQ